MKVEEFGFGFPPRIFGIRRRGTMYSINWIPLGGFVKIKGESGSHVGDEDSFAHKKIWQRCIVLVSGVAMNIVLAALLFTVGFMIGLPSIISGEVSQRATVRDEAIRFVQVLPESPAEKAGLKLGDVLVSIDDKLFATEQEAYGYISSQDDEMEFLVRRGDAYVSKSVARGEVSGSDGKIIGVQLVLTGFVSYPFFDSIARGAMAAVGMTWQVVVAFVGIVRDLVTTSKVGVEISGPVGIAVLTGEMAELGISYLIQFAAILSINLAVINILPFPALDGGRILFLAIEKIMRRKVGETAEAVTHNLGFMILIVLVVLVTYRDIVRFGDGIIGAVKTLF